MKAHRSNPCLALLASVALVGCATVDVRGIGSGGREPAYELRGATLARLETEAQRLCPKGCVAHCTPYAALDSRPEQEGGTVAGWWTRASDWVGASDDNDAQLTVSCKA